MATRRVLWVLAAALSSAAPGCVGEVGQPGARGWNVGASGAMAEVVDLDMDDDEALAEELATDDCVEAGHVAASQGSSVEWSLIGPLGRMALLSIDGVIACSIPTNQLGPADRIAAHHEVVPIARQVSAPKPDESGPNPEPAGVDTSGPNPEPAGPNAGPVILKSAGPDESGPNPEPASDDESGPNPEPADPGSSGTPSES